MNKKEYTDSQLIHDIMVIYTNSHLVLELVKRFKALKKAKKNKE